MTEPRVQAAIDELYAAPLDAFTAERTRIARELREAGERPAAAEVAKVPKPSPPAWALNHVAREQPQTVAAWLDSARALREASARAAEVGGDAIRAASADHRVATAGLLALVRVVEPGGKRLSEPMLDRVRALLHAATADAEVAERLRAARLTEEAARAAAVPAAGPAAATPCSAPAPAPEPAVDHEAEARARRRAELSRRIAAATEAAQRAREEVVRRDEAAGAADARLEEARRTLHRSESEAAAAHDAAADAHEAAAATERELEQLRADLRRETD